MATTNGHPPIDNPFEGWTTIEDAADMVGRDHSTLRYWADNGKIACFPVGRKMRVVNIEEVKAYSGDARQNKIKRTRRAKSTKTSQDSSK